VTVPLIAPGSMFIERTNELDLRVAKILRSGRTRTNLNFDLFNVSNADVLETGLA
jgi:hypothetical protein